VERASGDADALEGLEEHFAVLESDADLALEAEEEFVLVVLVRRVAALVAHHDDRVTADASDLFGAIGFGDALGDAGKGHPLGHRHGWGSQAYQGAGAGGRVLLPANGLRGAFWRGRVQRRAKALCLRPARGATMLKVAPSILSADFSRLGEEVRAVEAAGADAVHVDVMDGRFVPNITLGPVVVKGVRRATSLPLDCHLMIVEPERYVEDFVRAGADGVTVHAEATTHLDRTLHQIQDAGAKAGVSLNPATPVAAIEHVVGFVDLVLVMTVNPGFGGQSFIEACVPKIRQVAELAKRLRPREAPPLELEVDGGINAETARIVERAGATMAVAGNAVYNTPDYAAAIRAIRGTQKRLTTTTE
jgi:ribulose-phosphate 3-epimerase